MSADQVFVFDYWKSQGLNDAQALLKVLDWTMAKYGHGSAFSQR